MLDGLFGELPSLSGFAALERPRRPRGYVRVNAPASQFCYGDLVETIHAKVEGVILPKVESAADLHAIDWLIWNLERSRGGEQFTVLGRAGFPSEPDSPKPMRVWTVTVLLGVVLGAGLALGREYLDRSVHDARALNDLDVPCGPIMSTADLANDEHVRGREMWVELDHPQRGKWYNVGMPIKLSASPARIRRSPLLGEHTEEVLREVLGYSDERIAQLKSAGAFSAPPKKAA